MYLIIIMAVIVSAAGVFGVLPEYYQIANMPVPLIASSIVTAAMVYVLARS